MQGRLWPRSDDERERAEKAGYDISKVSTLDAAACSGLACLQRKPADLLIFYVL